MPTTTNCGNLHIRTPQTDTILVPNIISQSIVATGMRLGIIPETSVLGEFSYNIVVKNSSNNIIFQNSIPIIYTGYGNYLYIIIPFTSLPNVGEIINIKVTSIAGCTTNTDYTILSYTTSSDTTTVNVNGAISKYLKLKPSISYGGYFKDNFYYFKCNSNVDTDDECYIQFKKNTDTSKVLNVLPTDTEIVSCPDSSDWVFINTICVSNTPVTTTSTTTSTTTLTPCNTGLKLDNIVFNSGTTYKIYFSSTDVQSITWKLFNNINVLIKTGNSGQLVTSSFDADFGVISDGTYTLIIQSNNCSSNIVDGTKSFTKGIPSITTTTLSGSSTTTSTTTISGSGVNEFTNVLKNVSGSSQVGVYFPQAFPTIVPTYSIDTSLNKSYPNWAVAWQVEGGNFQAGNRTVQNVGISFNYDMLNGYNSYGVRCLDYVFETDPNTGNPWVNDIDTNCTGSQYDVRYGGLAHTWQNFRTRIPFENKAFSGYGVTQSDSIADRWDMNLSVGDRKTHTWIFDRGIESVASRKYGHGDNVGNKVNVGLINTDVENGEELGENGSNNHLAFAMGMASGSLGYVFSQYSAPLNIVTQQPSLYPESNGTYLSYRKNLDGSVRYWVNPSTNVTEPEPNNIPSSNDWNPTNKLTISGRITNKGLIDFTNFLPCSEISSTSDMTFRQGETYKRTTEGGTRLVNKFGISANTNHIIADVIQGGEVNKWYTDNKFDGRKIVLQTKITCDRANLGIFYDAGFTNEDLKLAHYNRRYAFIMGGMTALLGCEWTIWDRNYQNHVLDGYHGAFGVINLLNQQKNINGVAKSFIDLKPNLEFLLWNSEISYTDDNSGNTIWVKDKSYDYIMNMTHIPQRQAITSDGYWVGFLSRPENTEATSCKLRVSYNGNYYYYTVTPDMWETVNYNLRNTSLNQIPNSDKDYHYFLVKLSSSVTTQSTTSSSTTTTTTSTTTTNSGTDGFTMTQPNKPQYYFSNGHNPSYYDNALNLPAIHQSATHPESVPAGKLLSGLTMPARYNETDDIVWLTNNYIKIGINLKRGGHIAWASLVGSTTNMIYNGYDGGFQIGLDAYQNPDGYTQEGQNSGLEQSGIPTSYNVTHGGDFKNNAVSLIDYHPTTNGYYVKLRPIHYPMRALMSETYIEVTYTLTGNAVKCDYKYTSFRTDSQAKGGIVGWGVPACFLVNTLNRYKTYNGSSPFTNDSNLTDDYISTVSTAGTCGTITANQSTENWIMCYNQSTGLGIGVYNATDVPNRTRMEVKQCEVYPPDGAGTEFAGGFSFMQPTYTMILPSSGDFIKTSTAYILVGTEQQIRQKVYQINSNS
jgi:hypothetical protein